MERKITQKDIEKLADSYNIFKNGLKYYHWGAVKSFRLNEDKINAKVQENSLCKVKILLTNLKESRCNCPYGGPGRKQLIELTE